MASETSVCTLLIYSILCITVMSSRNPAPFKHSVWKFCSLVDLASSEQNSESSISQTPFQLGYRTLNWVLPVSHMLLNVQFRNKPSEETSFGRSPSCLALVVAKAPSDRGQGALRFPQFSAGCGSLLMCSFQTFPISLDSTVLVCLLSPSHNSVSYLISLS